MSTTEHPLVWHRVADADALEDGRVTTVQAGHRSIALTRIDGRYGALDNHCPHQGGPLGEGSIEKGLLRCPWHGYDYDPLTGTPAAGVHATRRPASRSRCARTASTSASPPRSRHVRDRLRRDGRDDGRVGRHPRVRHGRPLEPRLRRRDAPGRGARRAHASSASATRAPPRSRPRPTASSPAGRRPASRSRARAPRTCSPGSTTRRSTARRCSRSRARCRRRCSAAARSRTSTSSGAFADVATFTRTVPRRLRPRRADDPRPASTPWSSAASRTSCSPTRCRRCRPREGARASGPAGRLADAARRPAGRRAGRGARRCSRGARRPVIVRRPRRPLRHGRRRRASPRRSARRSSPRSRPRAWSPTTTRSAGGVLGRSGTPVASWLMNESDLLLVFGRLVLEPHRHRALQADRAGRLRPDGARPLPPGDGARCSATSA